MDSPYVYVVRVQELVRLDRHIGLMGNAKVVPRILGEFWRVGNDEREADGLVELVDRRLSPDLSF